MGCSNPDCPSNKPSTPKVDSEVEEREMDSREELILKIAEAIKKNNEDNCGTSSYINNATQVYEDVILADRTTSSDYQRGYEDGYHTKMFNIPCLKCDELKSPDSTTSSVELVELLEEVLEQHDKIGELTSNLICRIDQALLEAKPRPKDQK